MRKHVVAAATAVVIALTAGTAAPAAAETRSKRDPDPRCSQAAPLDLKRAAFAYSDGAFKTRLRMGELSKKRTQVFSRFYVEQGDRLVYGVQLVSAFRNGKLRTVGYWTDYENEDYSNRFTNGLSSSWDFGDDMVRFTLTRHLRGQRVDVAAYSVRKGADHGPLCGDYIFVDSLRRG